MWCISCEVFTCGSFQTPGQERDLVEDIFGSASEEDGASLGILAVNNEGVKLVTNLLDFKEACLGANVTLFNLLRPAFADSIHSKSERV